MGILQAGVQSGKRQARYLKCNFIGDRKISSLLLASLHDSRLNVHRRSMNNFTQVGSEIADFSAGHVCGNVFSSTVYSSLMS